MAKYIANEYPSLNIPPRDQFVPAPEVHKIRDWLPWSITNIFVGWFLLGIIALVFSILCRSKKRENDVQGARSMGTLALITNIISTLLGIAAWIGLIVYLALVAKAANTVTNPYVY